MQGRAQILGTECIVLYVQYMCTLRSMSSSNRCIHKNRGWMGGHLETYGILGSSPVFRLVIFFPFVLFLSFHSVVAQRVGDSR